MHRPFFKPYLPQGLPALFFAPHLFMGLIFYNRVAKAHVG